MHFPAWCFVDTVMISTEEFTGITEERKDMYGDAYLGF